MTTWSARSCLAARSPARRTSTTSSPGGWRSRIPGRAARWAAPRPTGSPQTGWRVLTRLARDHYVRLDANDYSVHPAVIGRRIEVTADLGRVRAFCDGHLVADHERSWAWHQSFTDPAHRSAAVALRAQRVAVLRRPAEPEVQIRALADYDAALRTGGGVA